MNLNAIDMSSAIVADVQRQNPSIPAQVVGKDQVTTEQIARHVSGDDSANNKQIREQIADMQRQIDMMNVSLTFSTYGDRGEKISIVVADKETGKVIREIPSKEIQELYAKMNELAGMILNGRA